MSSFQSTFHSPEGFDVNKTNTAQVHRGQVTLKYATIPRIEILQKTHNEIAAKSLNWFYTVPDYCCYVGSPTYRFEGVVDGYGRIDHRLVQVLICSVFYFDMAHLSRTTP